MISFFSSSPWRTLALVLGSLLLASGSIGAQIVRAADTIMPIVGMPTVTGTVYVNARETIRATYSDTAPPGDTAGVSSCVLLVGGSQQGTATLSGGTTNGTASVDHTFTSNGNVDVNIRCTDMGGNVTTSPTTTITVVVDSTAPSVGTVSPVTAVRGTSTTFTATYADTGSGVSSCVLHVQQGDGTYLTYNMTESADMSSGSATQSFTYSSSMTNSGYSQFVTCTDAAGNVGTGSLTTVSLTNSTSSDTTPPVINTIAPSSASVGSAVNVIATYSDAVGVTTCSLYVDGILVGSMDRSGTTSGNTSRSHLFSTAGSYTAQVRCSDAAGNTGNASTVITVGSGASGPYVRRLIKLFCPSGFIDVNHPCKAVYYVGSDGRRHAFPNEKVYFTWYTNFSGVVEVDSSTMASIALGKNVAYRPGTRMVKFATLNRTYAVTRYGTLRWVTSEAAAASLYGPDWNRMIDDISDAFYTDYTFGTDISSSASYSPTGETSSVSTIDMNL